MKPNTVLIDSHCHIYPEKIAEKAIRAVDSFYHGLPGCPCDGTPQTLLRLGREAGVSHCIVHSVATSPAQVRQINRFIASSAQESGGYFTGLGTLHPESALPEEDLDDLIALGLKGVKIHPDIQHFAIDSEKAFRLFAACEARGTPVLVHTGDYRYDYSNPERTVNVLKAFPRLHFIGAHFGGWSVWGRALRLLPDFPNIMVDTSSTFSWLSGEKVMELIQAFGADRVMFGSDYPMWHPQEDIHALHRLPLPDEEYEQIAWRTCAALYGISIGEGGT